MKPSAILMVLAIGLLCSVSASPDNVTIGPYNVSFDSNTTKTLTIQPQYPDAKKSLEGESVEHYGLEITDRNTPSEAAKAQIGIYKYDVPIPSSLEYDADQAAKLFHVLDRVVTVNFRTIDGRPGYVVNGVNKNGRIEYSAGYRLDEMTEVDIIGSLPEIRNILDTIRIEKTSINGK
jgi:opacity protein-like surface antigen